MYASAFLVYSIIACAFIFDMQLDVPIHCLVAEPENLQFACMRTFPPSKPKNMAGNQQAMPCHVCTFFHFFEIHKACLHDQHELI